MSVALTPEIRTAFPAMRRMHMGHPVAYFDGPGGTQVPQAVVDAMAEYLLEHNANTAWAYPSSEETDALLWNARAVFAEFVGGRPQEIVFGNNMTTITFHVARALARGWQAGDEVIITELDHHANVAPWQAVAREKGIVLRSLTMDPDSCQLQLDRLPDLIGPRTRLLAIGGASNAVGTINDVARAAAIAHAHGALVYVDGVHLAPHVLPDIAALDCDFFACSAYKFYGPHVGVLWGREALLNGLDVPKLEPAPAEAPERLETGTQNHEGILGAAAAVRWLASLSSAGEGLREQLTETYRALHQRELALFDRLWRGLGSMRGITRYGPPEGAPRTATAAFTVAGQSAHDVAVSLAAAGCFVSHGDFYATTVAQRLGVAEEGVVRVGAACYTTEAEIDRVLSGVQSIVGR